MKYARCAKCELNYVEEEGEICALCRRDEGACDDMCSVCGENAADGDDGLCTACRGEPASADLSIEEEILFRFGGED